MFLNQDILKFKLENSFLKITLFINENLKYRCLAPALRAQSLSRWITRKVPICIFKYRQSLPFVHVLPVKGHTLETWSHKYQVNIPAVH